MKRTGKEIQSLGKVGEERARWYFAQIGARCVEKISTPMLNIGGKAVYCKRSSIDFTIALPTPGYMRMYQACRIEVKLCNDYRLRYSRLSNHQHQWLYEWSQCGFWSFVLWVHNMDCIMFLYPNDYFVYGKSITIEQAKSLCYKQHL